MDKVHVIRHKVLIEGQSIRQVSRELGIHRDTISKYLKVAEPKRIVSKARPSPVLNQVRDRIDIMLEEFAHRTTAKQRVTAPRLHHQLREEGFDVGLTTVSDYLREKRRQKAEVFIPLIHRPGDAVQVDFFEVTADIDGRREKLWKFLMRLMHSGRDFVYFYRHCNQLSFLDGHVRAFEHFGGVPRRAIYDNLSAAVRKRVKANIELTEKFKALVSHYLFEPCFARPGEGHDKGGVEGRGRGIRLRHLTPIPIGKDLQDLSAQIQASIDKEALVRKDREGRCVMEKFVEERLRQLPEHPFDARRTEAVGVDRKGLVIIDAAKYSVPSTWSGLTVTAHVGVEDIRFSLGETSVTRQVIPKGKRDVQYLHYLPELAKKPQAVRQVAPELLAELGHPFPEFWDKLCEQYGEREAARVFARLLGSVSRHGREHLVTALEVLLGESKIKALPTPTAPKTDVPAPLAAHQVRQGQLAPYDILLAGGCR